MNPTLHAQIKVSFKVTSQTVVDFFFPRKIDAHVLVEEIPKFRHLVVFTDFTGAWKCALNTFNNTTWDSNKVKRVGKVLTMLEVFGKKLSKTQKQRLFLTISLSACKTPLRMASATTSIIGRSVRFCGTIEHSMLA